MTAFVNVYVRVSVCVCVCVRFMHLYLQVAEQRARVVHSDREGTDELVLREKDDGSRAVDSCWERCQSAAQHHLRRELRSRDCKHGLWKNRVNSTTITIRGGTIHICEHERMAVAWLLSPKHSTTLGVHEQLQTLWKYDRLLRLLFAMPLLVWCRIDGRYSVSQFAWYVAIIIKQAELVSFDLETASAV